MIHMRACAALALAASLIGATPVAANCRLALLLALDISSSVDMAEDALQRGGLAAALQSPEVVDAILSVPGQNVALAVYEWSGRYQQDLILEWRLLDSPATIRRAAAEIAASPRSYADFPTALGYALGHAASLFQDAPVCDMRVIDVSGDGVNNEGFPPRLAYRNFDLAEVTVNGLAIQSGEEDIAAYYLRELIRGPGAFVEVAQGFEDFERAMRRKLVRETKARILGAMEP
jgi:hypothetical protein